MSADPFKFRSFGFLLIALLLIGLLSAGMRWRCSQQLLYAKKSLESKDYDACEKALASAMTWFAPDVVHDEAALILVKSRLAKLDQFNQINEAKSNSNRLEEMAGLRQEVAASLLLLHSISPGSVYFCESRLLLANERFFNAHRFREAEDLIREGLHSNPFDCQLLSFNLHLLVASGRQLEAIESFPVDALKIANKEQRTALVQDLTKAAFFPTEFNLEWDRELGILAESEQTAPNTDLDRWTHFVVEDYSWTPAHAAIVSWYLSRDLLTVARVKLLIAESAFRTHPDATYLEQYCRLNDNSGKLDPAVMDELQKIASPCRFKRVQIQLEGLSATDEWKESALLLDRELLEFCDKRNPSDANVKAALEKLDYWTQTRRTELLQAIEAPTASSECLTQCWEDVMQKELAELLTSVDFFNDQNGSLD